MGELLAISAGQLVPDGTRSRLRSGAAAAIGMSAAAASKPGLLTTEHG